MPEQELELLAPAGTWEVLESVACAGADAVYAGGKRFNMRVLRADFNLTDTEIIKAVNFLHGKGKKLYITVNNLFFNKEMEELKDYLLFLQEAGVDAIIIQDFGVIELCRQACIKLPLHASVQASIANLETVKVLEMNGIKRVILSKNVSLKEIKEIKEKSSVGIEFFAHGDLCISHAGQCYMSSFLAGESGNRGRCIKPCRWHYQAMINDSLIGKDGFWLAHNDLCLYSYLQDMVDAGVTSFKIEGRMRDAEYLTHLVKIYREALDNIIEDPSYTTDSKAFEILQEKRIRDFSTGNLFNRSDMNDIGFTGAREPIFPSTAFTLESLSADNYFEKESTIVGDIKEINVKVGNIASLKAVSATGINGLILDMFKMRQGDTGWTASGVNNVLDFTAATNVRIILETPRILAHDETGQLIRFLSEINPADIEAVIVNDAGALKIARDMGFNLWGGYGLNITNNWAQHFYAREGIVKTAVSPELDFDQIKTLGIDEQGMEITVQGPLCGIITDFCIPRSIAGDDMNKNKCSAPCIKDQYSLCDNLGQAYLIKTDSACRNYIYYPYDICLLSHLPQLAGAGIRNIRIDGQYYNPELLKEIIQIYQEAISNIREGKWKQKNNYHKLLDLFSGKLSAAPVFITNTR